MAGDLGERVPWVPRGSLVTRKKNAHLFNICEPVPPSRFMQVICDLMFVNLGIVELRSVPTANTVICTEITLDFKMIDG